MDAKLKAKWVKALRSGRYKQGEGYLKDGDTYCCLGVLCRVQGVDPELASATGTLSTSQLKPAFSGGLPLARTAALANMNDGNLVRQHSFREIADYIEKNL